MNSRKNEGEIKTSRSNRFIKGSLGKVQKNIALNIFRRSITPVKKDSKSLCSSLEKNYLSAVGFAFRWIKKKSIDNFRGYRLGIIFGKIAKTSVENFSEFIFSIRKETELKLRTEKLEKLLKGRKRKVLKDTNSEFSKDFCLTTIKRVVSSVTYRLMFYSFALIQSINRNIAEKSMIPTKKLLCFSLRSIFTQNMQWAMKIFSSSLDHFKRKATKLLTLNLYFKRSLQKVITILKYHQKIPKYFLSKHWKNSTLNPYHPIKFHKISAITKISTILEKKISCYKCFAYYKLMASQPSNYLLSGFSPMKYSEKSTESSLLSIQIKPPINEPDKNFTYSSQPISIFVSLVKSLFLFEDQHLSQVKIAFNRWKFQRSPRKKYISRVPCKYLPTCRKLQKSNTSVIRVNKDLYQSHSPINKSQRNIKKK